MGEGSESSGERRECVWCGATSNFDREHVIGEQIAKVLNTPYPAELRWGDYAARQGKRLEIVLENRVCKTCNKGWMRRLDNLTMDFMHPAFKEGASVDLRPNRQKRLAFWVAKVGLLLRVWAHDQSAQHPKLLEGVETPTLPIEDMLALYKRQGPLPHLRVWVGVQRERGGPPYFSSVGTLRLPNADRPEIFDQYGYRGVFGVGPLVCFLLSADHPTRDIPTEINPELVAPDAMLRVWPTREVAIRWPPPRELFDRDIAKIARKQPAWMQEHPPAEAPPKAR